MAFWEFARGGLLLFCFFIYFSSLLPASTSTRAHAQHLLAFFRLDRSLTRTHASAPHPSYFHRCSTADAGTDRLLLLVYHITVSRENTAEYKCSFLLFLVQTPDRGNHEAPALSSGCTLRTAGRGTNRRGHVSGRDVLWCSGRRLRASIRVRCSSFLFFALQDT